MQPPYTAVVKNHNQLSPTYGAGMCMHIILRVL